MTKYLITSNTSHVIIPRSFNESGLTVTESDKYVQVARIHGYDPQWPQPYPVLVIHYGVDFDDIIQFLCNGAKQMIEYVFKVS